MKKLEGEYIVREMAILENPKVLFSVEMWMDSPGKLSFSTKDRVTLYYRVNQIPGKSDFYTGPLAHGDSPDDFAKNRRVVLR